MAVRKTKEVVKREVVLEDDELDAEAVRMDNAIASLAHSRQTSSFAEIYLMLESEFGLTREQAKARYQRWKERRKARVAEAVGDPLNRGEAILNVRSLLGRMTRRRAKEEYDEQQAKANKKPFSPSRLTPSYGELMKAHDLLADLEGTRAPTKQFVVTADVSKAKLDLLGVQSAEEIAATIERGKKLLAQKGLKGRRVIEAHGEERDR